MPEKPPKPLLISGIQPTGSLTIGNYIGAIRSWARLREKYECFFFLADLHAIAARQSPEELLNRCYEFAAMFFACGVDPESDVVFVQSHVPAHAELTWILNSVARMGELGRMTQFKQKSRGGGGADANAALFDYPVLMAADILLYNADIVPVGEDQTQHLEMAANLAKRFNGVYGDVFKVPKPYFPTRGYRIRSLRDPLSKMSKSDENPDAYIALADPPEIVEKKIKSAVTDSEKLIKCGDNKAGICNLLDIYSAVTGCSVENIESRYEGKGYAELKKDLADSVVSYLSPIRRRYEELAGDRSALDKILLSGARKAKERAKPKMEEVRRALGLIPRKTD